MSNAQFSFNPYPFRYIAKFDGNSWNEELQELPNKGAEKEKSLPAGELQEILRLRNAGGEFPLVNYTSQYALGCFEGLKAYPQPDGKFKLFRPDANATRFNQSMTGLHMPPFPSELFIPAIKDILQRSRRLGYYPKYNPEWEYDNFQSAQGIYIRPFTYTEGGFGVNFSVYPWVIIVATEVGNYYDIEPCSSILVSDQIRATPNGTGWIKVASNYVVSALAKNNAKSQGYTEALFLDAKHRRYVEECSSCNIFFVLKDNTIVTPSLGDTILPGITRNSIITLIKDAAYKIEERPIDIEEVLDSAIECFATGTAVGINHFGKLTYKDRHIRFGDGNIGEISKYLQSTLKQIQYGKHTDTHNWNIDVSN